MNNPFILNDNKLESNSKKEVPVPFESIDYSQSTHNLYVGQTKSGKSKLMQYQIIKSIEAGEHVIIFDFKQDLVEDILVYLGRKYMKSPSVLKEKVILLDFSNEREFFPAINFLANDQGLNVSRISDNLLDSFLSHYTADGFGTRMQYVFPQLLHLLIEEQLSFEEVSQFFIPPKNNAFREAILEKYQDHYDYEEMCLFFQNFSKLSPMNQEGYSLPIISRVGRLLTKSLRPIFCSDNRIRFKEILSGNSGKVILVNLNLGSELIGSDQAALIGSLLFNNIYNTLLMRKGKNNNPVSIYVDEASKLANRNLSNILLIIRSKQAKVNIAIQDTEQFTSALGQDGNAVFTDVVSNCSSKYLFKIDSVSADRLVHEDMFHHFYRLTDWLDRSRSQQGSSQSDQLKDLLVDPPEYHFWTNNPGLKRPKQCYLTTESVINDDPDREAILHWLYNHVFCTESYNYWISEAEAKSIIQSRRTWRKSFYSESKPSESPSGFDEYL